MHFNLLNFRNATFQPWNSLIYVRIFGHLEETGLDLRVALTTPKRPVTSTKGRDRFLLLNITKATNMKKFTN